MMMSAPILLTFGLLALTVLLLWAPASVDGARRDWPWCAGLALATGAGWHAGILDWRAPLVILAFGALAWHARKACEGGNRYARALLLVLTGVAALLLALHLAPGFHNPVLARDIRFSVDGMPFTLWANVDKAVVGIVLVGVFCERIATVAAWAAMLRRIAPVVLSALVVVLGLGWLLGQVRPDVKWTPYSAWFLVLNLLITCVAEEAFFRGFLLERMRRAMRGWRGGRGGTTAAVAVSSILFGLAHLGGGTLLALLATLAGLHYAAAYLLTQCVEGAILTHFTLNAVHFLAFTYPALAG